MPDPFQLEVLFAVQLVATVLCLAIGIRVAVAWFAGPPQAQVAPARPAAGAGGGTLGAAAPSDAEKGTPRDRIAAADAGWASELSAFREHRSSSFGPAEDVHLPGGTAAAGGDDDYELQRVQALVVQLHSARPTGALDRAEVISTLAPILTCDASARHAQLAWADGL